MLVVAGDPDLAAPLAEEIDADLWLGPENGLAAGLPGEIRSIRSMRKWKVVILVLGVREILDRYSTNAEDRRLHLEIFGVPSPKGFFRLYEKDSFRCSLDELGTLLSGPNPRPFIMAVPVFHPFPRPREAARDLNGVLRKWCGEEDFMFLPEGIFQRGDSVYDDPEAGAVSRLWTGTVGAGISARLDELGA